MPSRSETYEDFWERDINVLITALIRQGIANDAACSIGEAFNCDMLTNEQVRIILRCEEWIENNDMWSSLQADRPRHLRGSLRERWETPFRKMNAVEMGVYDNSNDKNPYEQYVGLEIEVNDSKVKQHLIDKDVPNWDCVHDGSLTNGSEFRLRNVYRGDALFKEVENFCTTLFKRGYITDTSCSIHIHIDANKMTLKSIKTLIQLHKRYEKFLYDIIRSDRLTNRFCIPTGTKTVATNRFTPLEHAMSCDNLHDFKKAYYMGNPEEEQHRKYYDGRYWGLNVHSLFLNGTVELRHLHGTLDPHRINSWTLINLSLVNRAIDGLTRRERRTLEYSNDPTIREFINLMPDDIQIVFEKCMDKETQMRNKV